MTKAIKEQFPILRQQVNGHPLVYLDNAATTQKPNQVIESLNRYYNNENANIHRGIYKLAAEATQAYEASRNLVATFLNAKDTREIIFTRGTTESINLVAQSFAKDRLEEGDELIISAMEHHSNLIPWQMACQSRKANLKVIPMNKDGVLDIDALKQLLNPKTKMLALVHISNTLGTINPVKEVIQLAQAQGIPVLIDAAQSAAHYPIDVQDLDCDFLAFSSHKVFGPTGVGVLYGKLAHLEAMEPYQFGGEMIHTVSFEETTFAKVPHKFEAGTPNIGGVIALGEAIKYIQHLDRTAVAHHLQDLLEYGTEQLSTIPGLKIIGTATNKTAILSFTMERIHPHDMATFLNEYGIAIRAGHHCTQPIMDFFEIPGTSRASFSIYNTRADIDQLVNGINKVRAFFGL